MQSSLVQNEKGRKERKERSTFDRCQSHAYCMSGKPLEGVSIPK